MITKNPMQKIRWGYKTFVRMMEALGYDIELHYVEKREVER